MKKIYYLFLLCFILFGCAKKEEILFENKNELNIVVATDLHYYTSDLFEDCSWFSQAMLNQDGQMIHLTEQFTTYFVEEMIQEQPDLVILSGDLTYNGEKVSHESLAELLSQLTSHQIEIALINGNHDLNNFFAYGYNEEGSYKVDSIDAKQFKSIYQNFGYKKAYSEDKNSLSYALHLNETYDLLVIDSCNDKIYNTGSAIQEKTMTWIKQQLEKTKNNGKKTIVVMHHNLGIHCDAIYSGYVLSNAEEMQSLFQNYDIPLVLSGHSHIQHTSQINNTYEIVSSALSIAPVQYGKLQMTNESIHYETKELTKVIDDQLFFEATSYNKFSKQLVDYFEKETANQIAARLAKLNFYYFSGNSYLVREEYKEDPYLKLLYEKEKLSFYTSYIDTILSENINHQQLDIK